LIKIDNCSEILKNHCNLAQIMLMLLAFGVL